jgi:phosphomannomutase
MRVPRHETGTTGRLSRQDLTAEYRLHVLGPLRDAARLPRPLRVVIDSNHGVAGTLAQQIFGDIENLSIELIHGEAAAAFAHEAEPTQPGALAELRKGVKDRKADLGVCFSPDSAQCAFVDQRGTAVGSDYIAALVGRRIVERAGGGTVVLDLRSTTAAFKQIQKAGGTALRQRVGPSHMRKLMVESHALFGADLTGRYYFRDESFCESAFLAFAHLLNLLSESGRNLSDLVLPLLRYSTSGPIRFRCTDPAKVMGAIAAAHQAAQLEELDGLTVKYPDWWFNVRAGGPRDGEAGMLGLTLEARNKKLVDQRLAELQPLLGERLVDGAAAGA